MELHILFGPTATSKTKLAQALWEKTHYPILSVDSRKVYQGADIGTNKLSLLNFMQAHPNVLVGGIDFVEPNDDTSVYIYQQKVFSWVEKYGGKILAAGGLIVHGGTGLYLDAILEGKSLLAPKNEDLRAELEKLPVLELQSRAKKESSSTYEKMNASDRLNPRRLIRVIENVALPTIKDTKDNGWSAPSVQKVLATSKRVWQINIPLREVLWPIINERVHQYYKEEWLDETWKLLGRYGPSAPALKMMGYRQLVEFMIANENWRDLAADDDPKFQAVTQQIQLAHRQYAKRQETWAKKYRQP